MEVVTIGSRTTGKSFQSRLQNFCGRALNVMVAERFNAAGVSALGGVEASCFAADDVTRNFGSQSGSFEGMLGTALDYAFEGTCRPHHCRRAKSQLGATNLPAQT